MKIDNKVLFGLGVVAVILYIYRDKIFSKSGLSVTPSFENKEEEDAFNTKYNIDYKDNRKPMLGDLLITDYSKSRCIGYEFSDKHIKNKNLSISEYAKQLKWNRYKIPNCTLSNDEKIGIVSKTPSQKTVNTQNLGINSIKLNPSDNKVGYTASQFNIELSQKNCPKGMLC